MAANAIRFQILTGARIGEVHSAKWGDLDLERGVWTKPSCHSKQKRTEHLPLSRSAVSHLSEMSVTSTAAEPHLFPGRKTGKLCRNVKAFWRSVTKAADLPSYCIHDNRHIPRMGPVASPSRMGGDRKFVANSMKIFFVPNLRVRRPLQKPLRLRLR